MKRLFFFFAGLLLAAPLHSFASAQSDLADQLYRQALEQHLDQSIDWLNLVHYKPNLFGGFESQVDGATFFLSPTGKTDPTAELKQTIESFVTGEPKLQLAPSKDKDSTDTPSIEDRSPQCRFPARVLFLKHFLGMAASKLPAIQCPKYAAFHKELSARSVTLVFSSFFLNNPGSAFGHSLLRINSTRSLGANGAHHELLDHGINFAANVTTTNPLLYAIFGSLGIFKGTFTSIPYYYKVREYNDYDSRDLWSYDLDLKPDEIQMLVAHIWELGSTYYDYFYFTENCSYHMFTTLEAAAPRLKLTAEIPFYVIPSDTMRAVMRVPGLVTHISYRPSVRSQFEYRLKNLDPKQVSALKELVAKKKISSLPSSFTNLKKAEILDAATDFVEFSNPDDLVKSGTETQEWRQTILAERAQLGVRSVDLDMPTPESERPDLGHGVRRLTVQQGHEGDRGSFTQLGWRFAMQDELDPGPGYPKNSQIEFLNGNFRYQYEQKHFEVEDIALFRVSSFTPYDDFNKKLSFKGEMSFQRIYDHDCDRCGAAVLNFGRGLTIQPFGTSKISLFAFADGRIDYSAAFFGSRVRLGAGPYVGTIANFSDNFRAMIWAEYRYEAFSVSPDVFETKGDIRYGFNRFFAIDASEAHYQNFWETAGAVMFYF